LRYILPLRLLGASAIGGGVRLRNRAPRALAPVNEAEAQDEVLT
jgi:hypothetical protein